MAAPAVSPARASPAFASPSPRPPLAPVESVVTPKKATTLLSAPKEVCSPQVNHLDRKVAITEKRINEEADRMKKDSEKVSY